MARKPNVIVGLGDTGMSYARFLAARGEPFVVMDQSVDPKRVEQLHEIAPACPVEPLTVNGLSGVQKVYVSPGVPLSSPPLKQAAAAGAVLQGDVQMFGDLASAPVVAVTGTNGKSTVARLVYEMAAAQMGNVGLGGNIGTPCLDILNDEAELYVVEMSSYQLELATRFPAEVAVVLNLAPDHMDRYPDLETYYGTKLQLYTHCRKAVVNRQLGHPVELADNVDSVSFGLDAPGGAHDFGLLESEGETWLAQGDQHWLPVRELKVTGTHNHLNVLAAFAIGHLLGLDREAMVESARRFTGLRHRAELVSEVDGVRYINDSKATNPGAMQAAVIGQSTGRNIHLIAGGETKGADFTGIGEALSAYVKSVEVIGQSQGELLAAFADVEPNACDGMSAAVRVAASMADPGDVVLLAPGCASFDEYRNYMERGDDFRDCVSRLVELNGGGRDEHGA